MHLETKGRVVVVIALLLLVNFVTSSADEREEFARQAGLDSDLVGLVKLDVGGTELTVVFVFINERTFSSMISPALRERLLPYLGKNAIYVNPNVKGVVSQFDFFPLSISVAQDGEAFTPARDAWVEITPGFLTGAFRVNPLGPEHGSGSEGILVLGDAIDPARPFSLSYMGEEAVFRIAQGTPAPTSASSHPPVEVEPLSDAAPLVELFSLSDFSSDGMAALLGLDADYVRTLSVTVQGGELMFLFVLLEEPFRESRFAPELIGRVEGLIGTGAVLTIVFSPTGAPFNPFDFSVKQSGTNYFFWFYTSFVELTDGFIRSGYVEEGGVAVGVIRLPSRVDPDLLFSIFFGSNGVSFP